MNHDEDETPLELSEAEPREARAPDRYPPTGGARTPGEQQGAASALRSIEDLLKDQDDYDEEFSPPSGPAFDAARKLLSTAYLITPGLPPLYAAPLGDGSLYLRWKAGSREVSVTIPAAGGPAMVWRSDPNPDECIPASRLPEYLHWLTQN